MRGKVPHLPAITSRARITPAYAGKSAPLARNHFTGKDHPRLCGEKIVPNVEAITLVGSPPPMRGKAILTRFKF